MMSAQFGIWNQDGRPVDLVHFEKAKALLAPYGPDDVASYEQSNIALLYRAFHTTKESCRETQPHTTVSGAVITLDGRLDNRADLILQCRDALRPGATDVATAAAAYTKWGTGCFAKLVGDWAAVVWNPHDRSLVLANDPIGTRHLYYELDKDQVRWSTVLDPLVLLSGKTFAIEEEYIAGWLGFFPATHLTPYVGIHSVPPSSFVLIRDRKLTVSEYWNFHPRKRIHYSSDSEYEDHFRAVFAESVRRRLRSDRPITSELSGGMDSSSIVCMADSIIACGDAETPRLDTISYYDDSEPNWNERPYFTKVEEARGRKGCHIPVGRPESFSFTCENVGFAAVPGANGSLDGPARQFAAFLRSREARVVLSGIGGDEVLGGVPTPGPELEDLLASAQVRQLARRLKAWALNKRKPWIHLLFEAVRVFLPPPFFGVPRHRRPAAWLHRTFARKNRLSLQGYERRLTLRGPMPSFQENIAALNALRRQLACDFLSREPLYEKRYPYLDRDLLEFLYAIPREQLVRPGQRRSLMRRALAGIVPDEVLNRKRKAFVSRAPAAALAADWTALQEMVRHLVTGSLKIVDPQAFAEALQRTRQGKEDRLVPLLRTLYVEWWLRNLCDRGILDGLGEVHSAASAEISAEKSQT